MSWPRGLSKAVAIFDAHPSDFENTCGLRFEHTEDQLDECDAALVKLMSGASFALVSYRHHPVKGVQLWIFESSPSPRKDLIDAMQALQGVRWHPLWIHGDIGGLMP